MPDEEAWVRQARAGDRAAFAALVERYWIRIFRWLTGMSQNPHTAEDLTQEVFLRAWSRLGSLKREKVFSSWLFRIARNCWIDQVRSSKGETTHALPEKIAASEPDPATRLVMEENGRLFRDACGRLPASFRAAFLLWTQERFSYSQIARALKISEENARWRVCMARKFLVKTLKKPLDQAEP